MQPLQDLLVSEASAASSCPMCTNSCDLSLVAGGGAEQHAEGGVKTGREANPSYKRPEPEKQQKESAPSKPDSVSAGFASEPSSFAARVVSSRLQRHSACSAECILFLHVHAACDWAISKHEHCQILSQAKLQENLTTLCS